MKRIALITGATSGIGEATARLLSENDYNLIICGRREDRLIKLKSELINSCQIYTLTFDVRNQELVKEKIGSLPDNWRKIDALINNAGNAHGLHAGSVFVKGKGILFILNAIVVVIRVRIVTRTI